MKLPKTLYIDLSDYDGFTVYQDLDEDLDGFRLGKYVLEATGKIVAPDAPPVEFVPNKTKAKKKVMLFLLAAVVACVSWTVTQEEIFKEPREYCKQQSLLCRAWAKKKLYYVFTCEYCFSHYVAASVVWLTHFRFSGMPEVGGYIVSWLVLVGLANIYMSTYRLLRLVIKLIGLRVHVIEDARSAYLAQQEEHK